MNKIIAIFVAILVVISFIPTGLFSFASNKIDLLELDDISQYKKLSIDELQNSILVENFYTDGMERKYEINNISQFKAAIKLNYPQMSDYELGKTILMALGDTEEQIASMPEDKVLEAINYTSLIISDKFFAVNEDGEQIEMSEEEFYADVARQEALDIIQNSNNNSTTSNSTNPLPNPKDDRIHGNLRLNTRIFRRTPSSTHTNRFTIRAEAIWVNYPSYKSENDILAIVHTSTANIDNNFSSCGSIYYKSTSPQYFNDIYDTVSKENTNGDYMKLLHDQASGMAVRFPLSVFWPGGDEILEYQLNNSIFLWHGITLNQGQETTIKIAYGKRTWNLGFDGISVDITETPSISFSPNSSVTSFDGYPIALSWNTGLYTITYRDVRSSSTFNGTHGSNNPTVHHYGYETVLVNPTRNGYRFDGWFTNISGTGTPITSLSATGYTSNITLFAKWILVTQEIIPTIPASNRYTEKIMTLNAGECRDYIVSFAISENKTIQTFGPQDSYLEIFNMSGTKLAGDSTTDDAGYNYNALISYNFVANTQYKIRVRYYNDSTSGDVKLAITPNNSVSDYGNLPNYSLGGIGGWALYHYQVRLFTYTFTTTRTVTFTTESQSNTDLYLYIIDPRSTDPIVQASSSAINKSCLYDDDSSGNLQAKITKTMDANIPYLVIVSAYNPANTSNPNPAHFNLWSY